MLSIWLFGTNVLGDFGLKLGVMLVILAACLELIVAWRFHKVAGVSVLETKEQMRRIVRLVYFAFFFLMVGTLALVPFILASVIALATSLAWGISFYYDKPTEGYINILRWIGENVFLNSREESKGQ